MKVRVAGGAPARLKSILPSTMGPAVMSSSSKKMSLKKRTFSRTVFFFPNEIFVDKCDILNEENNF